MNSLITTREFANQAERFYKNSQWNCDRRNGHTKSFKILYPHIPSHGKIPTEININIHSINNMPKIIGCSYYASYLYKGGSQGSCKRVVYAHGYDVKIVIPLAIMDDHDYNKMVKNCKKSPIIRYAKEIITKHEVLKTVDHIWDEI